MKRAVLALVVLAALVFPGALVWSAPVDIPHEDPAAAESDFDIGLPVLTHYADVLSLLAERKYEDTRAMIEQLDPDRATIPDDLKFAMQTYNSLLAELLEKSRLLDGKLDETEMLLDQARINDARLVLNEGLDLAQQAKELLRGIENANAELLSLIGPLAGSVELNVVEEAKKRLEEAMQRLSELETLYDDTLARLETEAENSEDLVATGITLELDKVEGWVGESIAVTGALTQGHEASPMAGREVMIALGGETELTVVTGDDGVYQADVWLPCRYESTANVQAKYVPLGDDQGVYGRCLCDPVEIRVSYYRTYLNVTLPEEAYPGLPLSVSGGIAYGAGTPVADRELRVLWDGQVVASLCALRDEFEVEVIPDAKAMPGLHALQLVVAHDGRYSNASGDSLVSVTKELPDVEISEVSFATMMRRVDVKGKVSSSLPMGEEAIIVRLGSASARTSTSPDGEFEASLTLPVESAVVGDQDVEVIVEPSSAWHLSVEARRTLFVVDIAKLGLVSVAFVSIGIVLYTRRRGSYRPAHIEVRDETVCRVEAEPASAPAPARTDGRERVLRAYTEVANLLEKATGEGTSPNMSLREFLTKAQPYLGESGSPFAELTYMGEEALYAPREPDDGEVARAEELGRILKESLSHGRT